MLDQIVAKLDVLGSLNAQLDAMPQAENLTDVSSIKNSVKEIRSEAKKGVEAIAKLAGEVRGGLDVRTARALDIQAKLVGEEIARKSEFILGEMEKRSTEIVKKVEKQKQFDFSKAILPLLNHWSAAGKDVKKHDGGAIVKVPGHRVILAESTITVECEDQTGLRRLVEYMADEHPFVVTEASGKLKVDRAQFSEETQEILKKADDASYHRIKALKPRKKKE